MDLRHLRYFVTVAEELHFGRAADKLHISQPPLSQQIKALETELNVRLFDRAGRKVTLTVAGEAFLDEARATLARASRAIVVARQAQSGEVGRLAIGFTSSMPFVPIFAEAISAYRKAFPQVRVELSEMITRQQIAALLDGQLNAAFVRSPLPELPKGLSVIRILRDGLVVLVEAGHKLAQQASVAVADLQDYPLILMNPDAHTGLNIQLFAMCAEAGFSPRIAQYAMNPWTPIGLATLGMGVAIVHSSLVERLSIEGLAKVPLRVATNVNEVYFAHFDKPSPAAREFAEIVRRLTGSGALA